MKYKIIIIILFIVVMGESFLLFYYKCFDFNKIDKLNNIEFNNKTDELSNIECIAIKELYDHEDTMKKLKERRFLSRISQTEEELDKVGTRYVRYNINITNNNNKDISYVGDYLLFPGDLARNIIYYPDINFGIEIKKGEKTDNKYLNVYLKKYKNDLEDINYITPIFQIKDKNGNYKYGKCKVVDKE